MASTNMVEDDEFMASVNNLARDESASRKGSFPETANGSHKNYEVLPIQELRKEAEKLNIKDFDVLNKQKLIEAIRNASVK